MIEPVGYASAEAATVTIPSAAQPGDIVVIFAFNDGSVTNPTIPTGWTNITNTLDGTTCSASVGWKVFATGDTSGTWTSATGLMCIVSRSADILAPIMTNATSTGTTNTVTFAALTNANLRGARGYHIFAFLAHRSTDTNINAAPPTGMANVHSLLGATQDMAVHQATSDSEWASTNASITGTASGWISMVLAIRPARLNVRNYHGISSGDNGVAGVISVTEKIR